MKGVLARGGMRIGEDLGALQEMEEPEIGDDEVLIKVAATAINRSDIGHDGTSGFSNLPNGNISLFGNECSGHIIAVGPCVTRWNIGDPVCAIIDGGGYFEQVAVKAEQVLPAPSNISLVQAAGLPLAACSVWHSLFTLGGCKNGNIVLIRDCYSINEVIAIQMAKSVGARVIVAIGVDIILEYGHGIPNFQKDCAVGIGAVIVVHDLYEDRTIKVDIQVLIAKNVTLKVFDRLTLLENRISLIRQVEEKIWPHIGMVLKLIKYMVWPLTKASEAQVHMRSKYGLRKILLSTSEYGERAPKPSGWKKVWPKIGPMVKKLLKQKKAEKHGTLLEHLL